METWKVIPGWEYFEASDKGNIRRIKKSKYKSIGNTTSNKKLTDAPGGYKCVSLWQEGRNGVFSVHRLVAMTFIPGDISLSVNHINGKKDDNRVENLEWCTLSDNSKHQWRTGLAENCKKTQFSSTSTINNLCGELHHLSGRKWYVNPEGETTLVNENPGPGWVLGRNYNRAKKVI